LFGLIPKLIHFFQRQIVEHFIFCGSHNFHRIKPANEFFIGSVNGITVIRYEQGSNWSIVDHIKGVMLESFLNEGNQGFCQSLKPGVSVTDPCLSFENTEKLILYYYKLVSQSQGSSSVSTASSLISISSSDT
jgi:hypothetical protein